MAGCNLFAPFYFAAIMAGMDSRVQPGFAFPDPDEKDYKWRVVVVTYANEGTQLEAGPIDRELNELLSRRLHDGFTQDREPIEIILASKLAKWQDRHPDWRSLEPSEVGRALKNDEGRGADYVVCLEVGSLQFHEPGGGRLLYHGHAEIAISVVKVNEEGGELVLPPETLSIEFPRGRPVESSQVSPLRFKRAFLSTLATQISWLFLPHDSREEFGNEPF